MPRREMNPPVPLRFSRRWLPMLSRASMIWGRFWDFSFRDRLEISFPSRRRSSSTCPSEESRWTISSSSIRQEMMLSVGMIG